MSDEFRRLNPISCADCDRKEDRIRTLEADNEKMREALREVLNDANDLGDCFRTFEPHKNCLHHVAKIVLDAVNASETKK